MGIDQMESNGIQGHRGKPQTNQLLAAASPMCAPYSRTRPSTVAVQRPDGRHCTLRCCGGAACPVLEALNPISALAPASIAVFQSMGATT